MGLEHGVRIIYLGVDTGRPPRRRARTDCVRPLVHAPTAAARGRCGAEALRFRCGKRRAQSRIFPSPACPALGALLGCVGRCFGLRECITSCEHHDLSFHVVSFHRGRANFARTSFLCRGLAQAGLTVVETHVVARADAMDGRRGLCALCL